MSIFQPFLNIKNILSIHVIPCLKYFMLIIWIFPSQVVIFSVASKTQITPFCCLLVDVFCCALFMVKFSDIFRTFEDLPENLRLFRLLEISRSQCKMYRVSRQNFFPRWKFMSFGRALCIIYSIRGFDEGWRMLEDIFWGCLWMNNRFSLIKVLLIW